MPRVIIVDLPNRHMDLHEASEFGEILDIRVGISSPFRTEEFKQTLIEKLSNIRFDPEIDYVLMVGRILNFSMALAVMYHRYESLQIVIWSSLEQKYVVRTLSALTLEV